MKKFFFSFVVILFALSNSAKSADILGCPNGIPKGTIWPRLTFKYVDMNEKYDWATGKMVDINESGDNAVRSKKNLETDFRLGYGITSKTDIAVQVKYLSMESDYQKKAAGSKLISFDESALSELWFSWKYRFIDISELKSKSLEYFKLNVGAAYGFGLADDLKYVASGMGSGCDKAQLGLLMHGGLKNGIDFAGHLIYEWWGKAPSYSAAEYLPASETLAKNQYTFGQSGRNMPDKIEYMSVLEYALSDYIEIKGQLSGWFGVQKNKGSIYSADYKDKGFYAYTHNVLAGVEFYPMTSDYPKRKIGLQVAIPYSAKNSTSSDYVTSLISMWTF